MVANRALGRATVVLRFSSGCVVIIGLVGGKGAGKNTAAAYLAEVYGARSYAIANELKELLRDMFGLTNAQLHGTQFEKETTDPFWGVSPRRLMERQGDALRRVYGDLFQVDRLVNQIAREGPSLAVVSDIRYAHEAVRVALQGTIWRLHYAPGLRRWPILHSSEAEWMTAKADVEITPGEGGVVELHHAIDAACRMFGIVKKEQ